MKKVVIAFVLVGAVLAAVVGAAFAHAFAGLTSPEPDGRVGPAHVLVNGGFVSMYLVETGEGRFVLVDGGVETDAATVRAALASRGASAEALDAILLTHGHTDHVAAAYAFPDVPIYVHEADVDLVEGRVSSNGLLQKLGPGNEPGLKVARALKDREVLTFGDVRFELFHTPGHTAGNSAFLMNDVLLLGDTAQVRADGAIQEPPFFFSDDPEAAIRAVRGLAKAIEESDRKPTLLVGSHSGSTSNVAALSEYGE